MSGIVDRSDAELLTLRRITKDGLADPATDLASLYDRVRRRVPVAAGGLDPLLGRFAGHRRGESADRDLRERLLELLGYLDAQLIVLRDEGRLA